MNKLIKQLKEIAAQNPDGFTVRLPNLEPVKTGWVVALKATQNCFNDEGLEKAIIVATETHNVIGGWQEGNKWYWDASQIFETENEATEAGIANEQIAIYHLDTNTLKFL